MMRIEIGGLLAARMKFLDDLFEILPIQVGVDFSSGYGFVAQHFLYGSEICTPFYQMSGKRMAKSVRADILKNTNIDGVIATNTTIARENLSTESDDIEKIGQGGLSGQALKERSTQVIRTLRQGLGESVPIIGVGGIGSAQDAMEKMDAGATLVQIYTGFIYQGPSLIQNINKALLAEPKEN